MERSMRPRSSIFITRAVMTCPSSSTSSTFLMKLWESSEM